jgi:hypothetical protein
MRVKDSHYLVYQLDSKSIKNLLNPKYYRCLALVTATTAATMATTATDIHQSCHDNWQLATAAAIDPPYPSKRHSSSPPSPPFAGSVNLCALNGIYRHQISHQGRL